MTTRPVITVSLHLDTQPSGPSQGHKRVKSGNHSSLCKITYLPFQITGAEGRREVPIPTPENSVGSDRHASEQVEEPNRALFPADAKPGRFLSWRLLDRGFAAPKHPPARILDLEPVRRLLVWHDAPLASVLINDRVLLLVESSRGFLRRVSEERSSAARMW